jgi:hypothetical protein
MAGKVVLTLDTLANASGQNMKREAYGAFARAERFIEQFHEDFGDQTEMKKPIEVHLVVEIRSQGGESRTLGFYAFEKYPTIKQPKLAFALGRDGQLLVDDRQGVLPGFAGVTADMLEDDTDGSE